MKLAIHFPNFSLPGEPASLAGFLGATAKAADEGGCETMTLRDHWFQMEQRAPASERKTLRLVAKYADACNLFDIGFDELKRKLAILDEHCDALGRDPASVQRTAINAGNPLADVDAFLTKMDQYADLGISQIGVAPPTPDPAGFVTELTETVLPRLAQI
jgi:alkanesulfonate monooxygenase SsuD/methylene tetrahydromethanopterin reductase-like flavin-dependent oxidoreductase (luciferase family)